MLTFLPHFLLGEIVADKVRNYTYFQPFYHHKFIVNMAETVYFGNLL